MKTLLNMYEPQTVVTHNYIPGKQIDGQDKSTFSWIAYVDQTVEVININVDFTEPNEDFGIYGILLGMGSKSLAINVNIKHRAINTRSRVVLKGILTEKSSIKFNGITHIEHEAKETDEWLE